MEYLGAVQAGSEVAIEVLSLTRKLLIFCSKVQAAPRRITDVLEDLHTVAQLVEIAPVVEYVTLVHLTRVRDRMTEMEELLGKLESAMHLDGFKGKLRWGKVKVALSDEGIEKIVKEIDRAKEDLKMAIMFQTGLQVNDMHKSLIQLTAAKITINADIQHTTEIITPDPSRNSSATKVGPSISKAPRQSTKVSLTSSWYGFGWVQQKSTQLVSADEEGIESLGEVETEIRFLPAAWIPFCGFWIKSSFVRGQRIRSLSTAPVVPQACKTGNISWATRLMREVKASPLDINGNGWTLLHLPHMRAHRCGNGLGGMRDYLSWELLAPVDNGSRSSDADETVRILVEQAECDPLADTTPLQVRQYSLPSDQQTPLHIFGGSLRTFKYLLNQAVETNSQRSLDASLLERQVMYRSANSVSIIRFLLAKNDLRTLANHKYGIFNWTFLHFMLLLLRYCVRQPVLQASVEGRIQNIKDLVEAGADVHAECLGSNSKDETTPFARMANPQGACDAEDLTTDLAAALLVWLQILSDTGCNLKKYFEVEMELLRANVLGHWYRPAPHYSVIRTMSLEEVPKLQGVLLRIHEQCALEESDSPAIPGSWVEDDHFCAWDITWRLEAWPDQEITFFLGDLHEDSQEFGIWQGVGEPLLKHVKLRENWICMIPEDEDYTTS